MAIVSDDNAEQVDKARAKRSWRRGVSLTTAAAMPRGAAKWLGGCYEVWCGGARESPQELTT